MFHPDRRFMEEAIREAKAAQKAGDYAIGAVVVQGDDKILSSKSNRSKRDEDPFAHAEILAILEASKNLGRRHLDDCVLYTTHEPCPMCASLCVFARIHTIVYGAKIDDMRQHAQKNQDGNYLWRTIDISVEEIIGKSTETIVIEKEFMREECVQLFHS